VVAPYDFRADPEYQSYLGTLSGSQRKKSKRKTKKSGSPYYFEGYQPAGSSLTPGQGSLGTTPVQPAGSLVPSSSGQTATPKGAYDSQIADDALRAPAGTLAASIAGTQKNADALNMTATNPYLLSDVLMGDKYGLPAGSRSGAMLAENLNPQDKAMALMGSEPMNNIDWVNFGEALMTSPALAGNGVQLNPKTMVQTLVQGLMQATNNRKAGGIGPSDQFTRLESLVMQDPASGANAFASIVQGALAGTMPEDQLTAYVNWLKQNAQQFMTTYVRGDAAQMEASGQNWISALVQKLGPSLGL